VDDLGACVVDRTGGLGRCVRLTRGTVGRTLVTGTDDVDPIVDGDRDGEAGPPLPVLHADTAQAVTTTESNRRRTDLTLAHSRANPRRRAERRPLRLP
jgi:hypothetical protein